MLILSFLPARGFTDVTASIPASVASVDLCAMLILSFLQRGGLHLGQRSVSS